MIEQAKEKLSLNRIKAKHTNAIIERKNEQETRKKNVLQYFLENIDILQGLKIKNQDGNTSVKFQKFMQKGGFKSGYQDIYFYHNSSKNLSFSISSNVRTYINDYNYLEKKVENFGTVGVIDESNIITKKWLINQGIDTSKFYNIISYNSAKDRINNIKNEISRLRAEITKSEQYMPFELRETF